MIYALLAALAILASSEPRAQSPAWQGRLPDIGYEPTPPDVVTAMLQLARVGPADTVYDLGSGDGRIVIAAAAQFGARGVGIEMQPHLVRASRQAAAAAGVADRVTFVEGDFFEVDLSAATVVTTYLWPSVNDRLEPKLRRELPPGARIVSYTFPMGSWVPDATARASTGRGISLWVVPRRPAREPDVAFAPTPQPIVEQMLELARVGPSDVVLDLGSGDGRVPIVAAQRFGARGMGVEIVPYLVDRSKQIASDARLGDAVSFVEGDLFDADLSRATVVVLCLSASVHAKLEPRLRQLRPGTRIVSRRFSIGTWPPTATVRAEDGSELFLWIVPPRAPEP